MSASAYNLWKPDYLLDIQQLDDQHRKFFEYCSTLLMLADPNTSKTHLNADLLSVFFKLRAYAFKHFLDEESLMAEHKYPGIKDHIRLHNRYCVDFFQAVEDTHPVFDLNPAARMDEKSREMALFLSNFAAGWLEEHIYTTDKQLAGHILATGRPAP